MTETIIFYRQGLRYELPLVAGKKLLVSASEKGTLVLEGLEQDLLLQQEEEGIFYQYGQDSGLLEESQTFGDLTCYRGQSESKIYDTLDLQEWSLGSHQGASLYLDQSPVELLFQRAGDSWQLTVLEGPVYRNNLLLASDQVQLELGDEISFGAVQLKVYPDELVLRGNLTVQPALRERSQSHYGFYPDYPDFHRSPRIIYRSSEDKLRLNAPPAEPSKPTDELLKLIVPPLLMIGVTVLISVIQPRGIYILATMTMSAASVVFSIHTFFKNRKKFKENKKERVDLYHLYLKDKAIEFTELERAQKDGQLYHYPTIEELTELADSYHHRIYEKTPLHFDFLYYRLGLGQVPTSYDLAYSMTERSGKKDGLEEEGYALYLRHKEIPDMPVVANLSHGPVGYIGPRPLVIEQLQLLVNQLAVFHSYHDVQFITIVPEEERADWEWMRWLPHSSLQDMNVRGFVYNQRTHDQVLNSLNQILKLRRAQKGDKGQGGGSTLFSPHYVVLVTDEKLILDHVIMEFFTEDPTNLGCSLIFVQDVLSSLAENVKTIINIKDRNHGQLVMEEGVLKEMDFRLDHFPAGYDKERIARRLAPLNHLQNLKSSIPDMVTFLELYQAESFEDLHVLERWASHAPYKSLAVPIGLRGKEDVVQLNLHEKAHGPHGLIAGTTGSGKSETIQSYILSLAVNFHPHDVAFLLIDYKGGGMANLFKDLPHLLGTITNLDGAQSMRALVSINAELKRRQRLFAQVDVNHIHQYQKKYKTGEAPEPMPHLFLISDEFAELKANQPDFMQELVSTARIGRSLGIHLILATQKPSGVVNEQIWSNSRFKLALKVADRSDSMEMLQTPDASEITQTGRAYLQVGNNEVYELFQSAWSGAEYQPEKEAQGIEDQTIYLINELGQYDILNEDLSGLEQAEDIREVPTELDAIVSKLQELAQKEKIPALAQPWLPPLKREIFVQDLRKESIQELWEKGVHTLSAIIGTVDIPSQQLQKTLSHDFEADGNLVIFSAPAMGKSTLLQSLVMDLARQNRPDQLEVYLFDFGTNGLLPLHHLPHVADSFTIDDEEKITKFILRMKKVMAERKQLFNRYTVSNIALYRKASGEHLPDIFIAVDSYDGLKDSTIGGELENMLQILSREGASLGIYLAVSAGRIGVFKAAMLSTLKERIVLKMTDDSEAKTLIGRHEYIMEDIPGRGLKKLEAPEVFQTALPAYGKDSFQVLQELQAEAEEMSRDWTGARPQRIPIVPEAISFEAYSQKASVREALQKGEFPLGLDFDNVESVSLSLKEMRTLTYMTDNIEAHRALTAHLLRTITEFSIAQFTMLLDMNQDYEAFQSQITTYVAEEEFLSEMATKLLEQIMHRQETGERTSWLVIVTDFERFVSVTKITPEQWSLIYETAYKVGIYLIIGGSYQYIGTNIHVIPKSIRLKSPWTIFAMRISDQNVLDKIFNQKEPYLELDEIYIHNRKSYQKLKITSEKGE